MTEASLNAIVDRAFARLRATAAAERLDDPCVAAKLRKVAIASDFAIDTLVRQPSLLVQLLDDVDGAPPTPALSADNAGKWSAALRGYRAAESTRLIWRDLLGLDDVEATLAGSTRLAEACLRAALPAIEADLAQHHGTIAGEDRLPQRLVVFGLGKLGGGELNFSSDVDLVYGYAHDGSSEGPRSLDAQTYFARIGQRLAKLLDEVTADGFCHRVDLRLRPYGDAGRLAWSFAAMEQYFQREGRDWERYAWQKARPVAGDLDAGQRFLQTLRPFVYRRYLDFGALNGMRSMKATIAAEVARKELADDIKRGPGGIREIEFLVQALQLIRGGREPELRGRQLLSSLQSLVDANLIDTEAGAALAHAYRVLRQLENRLQMLRDQQTHALPEAADDRLRIARGLGHDDWSQLREVLDAQRARVTEEFDALLAPRRRRKVPDALASYWGALPDAGDADVLAQAGFDDARAADTMLRDLLRSPGVHGLSDSSRARLDRVLPALLQGAAASSQPLLALRRLLALLHNILRRSAYLALLDEQPAALARLVEVVSHSALLAERLAAYPLLLDELLDVRIAGPLPTREELLDACAQVRGGNDVEAALNALNEVRQALSFRMAMAVRDGRQGAVDSGRQLAWLADGVVRRVLALAHAEMIDSHGRIADARFAVLGYGSLGGEELSFGSDLDLVFLYDAALDAQSDGARPLEAPRWFARLAQKVVALLGTATSAGHLFDVDVRLRPDGAKGLLVSTLASFRDYQRARAWTWEHQALVRARSVAGDAALCQAFDEVRGQTLGCARDPGKVCTEVSKMRARMRAELDRSNDARFDLKQGEGGLVDLEFMLQALVLRGAHDHPDLLAPRNTPALIDAAGEAALLDVDTAAGLRQAHADLLARALDCSLDRRHRRVVRDDRVEAARQTIRQAAKAQGLDFTLSTSPLPRRRTADND